MFFWWAQVKYVIPVRWKKLIFDYSDINENYLYQNYYVTKKLEFFPSTNYPLRKYIQF